MAGPTVTATILANDQASPAIQKLANIAADASKQVNTHLDGVGKGRNYGGALNGMNFAFTAMAANALKNIAQVMSKLSEMESRMQAFGGATQQQARDITKSAITNGPQTPGGALGYAQSAKAGLQAGLTPEQAKLVAPHGTHYAKMNETTPEQGTEELLQLTNMWGNFKNAKGETVSPDQLTPQQFEAAVAKTRARYIREARQLPGKPRDLFEFYKMAGPAFEGAGVSEEYQGAMAVKLAQGGFSGGHSGTYGRGIVERAVTPTAGGRSSLAALGIDINKLIHVNTNAVDPENAVKSIQSQTGKLDDNATLKVRETADRLKKGELTYTEAVEQTASALKGQNKKGGKGVLDDQAAVKIANGTLMNYVDKIDFPGLVKRLKETDAGLPVLRKLFGIESGTGAKVLLHSDLDESATRMKQDKDSKPDKEVLREADSAMMNNIPASIERLTNTMQSLQSQVLQPYSDSAVKVMNTISDFGQSVITMHGPVKDLAGDLAIVAAGFAAFKTTAKIAEVAAGIASLGTASTAAAAATSASVVPTTAAAASLTRLAAVNIAGLATGIGLLAFAVYEAIKFMQGIPKSEENHNPRVQAWDRARNGIVKPGDTYEDLIHSEKWRANKRFSSGDPLDNPEKGSTQKVLKSWLDGVRDDGVYAAGQEANRKFGNTGEQSTGGWSDSVKAGRPGAAPEGDAKWGDGTPTKAQDINVNGTVSGDATVHLEATITPSAWFEARFNKLEAAVVSLKGQVGGDKLGTNLAGRNGAQPVPATGVQ